MNYCNDMPSLKNVIFFVLRLALIIAILPLFFAPRSDFDFNFPTTWQTVNEGLEIGHVFFFLLVASVTAPIAAMAVRLATLGRRNCWIILHYTWQRICYLHHRSALKINSKKTALWLGLVMLSGALACGGGIGLMTQNLHQWPSARNLLDDLAGVLIPAQWWPDSGRFGYSPSSLLCFVSVFVSLLIFLLLTVGWPWRLTFFSREWRLILTYAWRRAEAKGKAVLAPWVWLITLVLTFYWGFAIELAQGSFTNDCLTSLATFRFGRLTIGCVASLGDVFHDMVGVVIYLLWWQSRRSKRFRLGLRFLILLPALVATLPIALAAFDDYNIWKDFPVLASFEHKDELRRWEYGQTAKMRRVEAMARDGRYAAAIDYTTNRYSEVTMQYFYRDWRGFGALALDVYNPEAPVELMIKLYDRQHVGAGMNFNNRYNSSRVLEHGWNQIRIPMQDIEHGPRKRLMELGQMHGIQLFLMNQPRPRTLVISNIQLVR